LSIVKKARKGQKRLLGVGSKLMQRSNICTGIFRDTFKGVSIVTVSPLAGLNTFKLNS
uniref:30S ribosomal protein S8, chloroplastic n=1 Tax=Brugia timori TaxID=42155 RepID=A0A0R3QH16_9BILA